MSQNSLLKKFSEALIPTDWGRFLMSAYSIDEVNPMPHLVLKHPEIDTNNPVLVRVHSECLTGDLFHSHRCDCGEQLDLSMEYISKEKGMLIYLRQEGRGIGIINKLRAYNKQDEGFDTIEANLLLGFDVDNRDFSVAVDILEKEGLSNIKLLTNNPQKIASINKGKIKIIERIPIEIPPKKENVNYLKTKKFSMGHMLKLNSQL